MTQVNIIFPNFSKGVRPIHEFNALIQDKRKIKSYFERRVMMDMEELRKSCAKLKKLLSKK